MDEYEYYLSTYEKKVNRAKIYNASTKGSIVPLLSLPTNPLEGFTLLVFRLAILLIFSLYFTKNQFE